MSNEIMRNKILFNNKKQLPCTHVQGFSVASPEDRQFYQNTSRQEQYTKNRLLLLSPLLLLSSSFVIIIIIITISVSSEA